VLRQIKAEDQEAAVIIMNKVVECPPGKALLITKDPAGAYVKLVKHFCPFEPATSMISETAVIGEGTVIQPGVFIGNHCVIGKNCIIHSGVVIYDGTRIGNNVNIQGNSVIGGDAFYFNKRNNEDLLYLKLESCGSTIIEDDVEIGACCTIDRGVSGITIIGQGTKLDNLIHIGHGTIIGKNCLFAAQVGVAGKVIIGDNVLLYGQVGVSKDLTIESNTVVLAKSGVGKSLPGGKVWFGIPVQDAKDKMEELVWVKRIPELWDRMKNEY
ncbi:MAG TPA: UDP-3-O-(3-hydroxymyristoyl)glucosamine N-acyltransferase, partial [Chitinophagaceae bacterium]|nr:UDP-3-O-(3-hydroxymyristoyl)glucosamine N-acyltransferase [Chitinophagaceae bacterium]